MAETIFKIYHCDNVERRREESWMPLYVYNSQDRSIGRETGRNLMGYISIGNIKISKVYVLVQKKQEFNSQLLNLSMDGWFTKFSNRYLHDVTYAYKYWALRRGKRELLLPKGNREKKNKNQDKTLRRKSLFGVYHWERKSPSLTRLCLRELSSLPLFLEGHFQ